MDLMTGVGGCSRFVSYCGRNSRGGMCGNGSLLFCSLSGGSARDHCLVASFLLGGNTRIGIVGRYNRGLLRVLLSEAGRGVGRATRLYGGLVSGKMGVGRLSRGREMPLRCLVGLGCASRRLRPLCRV